jgi:hypothetical protein
LIERRVRERREKKKLNVLAPDQGWEIAIAMAGRFSSL